MPLFSLMIAVYNAEPWLEACLDSLLAQTEPRWQAICVDDCSTDASRAILDRYAAADDRFMVIATPQNEGQAKARNRAVPLLEGEWALMLDADDWLSPDALQLLLAAAQHHPAADSLALRLVRTCPDGTEAADDAFPDGTAWTGTEACRQSLARKLHGLYAVRTEFYRQWPFDDSARLYSDDNTAHQHFLHSQQVVQTAAKYYYRQHPDSTTHQWSPLRLCFLEANSSLRSMLEEEDAEGKLLRLAERWIWHNFVGIWRSFDAHRADLSEAERRSGEERLEAALQAMRPLRLPLLDWLRPAYIFMRPLPVFEKWQRLLIRLKGRGKN